MGAGFFTGLPQYTNPYDYSESMKKLQRYSPKVVYSCHNEPMDGSLIQKKAQDGIDMVNSITDTVERYVKKYQNSRDFSLRNMVAYTCGEHGKKVGGGACVTIMVHLNEIKDRYPSVHTIIKKHCEDSKYV